ncbi:sulfotransferase domain-containing protein [Roseibacillus persicicus]|uniref:sulfotransferase domain-containing protein n=1 Tax=Roseibacillus persicicus TaxID=454148 RepID=UPI00398B5C19
MNRFLWNVGATLNLNFGAYVSDEQAGGNVSEAARRDDFDILTLRNARWDHVAQFPDTKAVHIVRDPRDIVVSGYFSHLKTHKIANEEYARERERLQSLSKEEGLIETLNGINARTLADLQDWKTGESPNILEFRLEEMSGEPMKYLKKILLHADLMRESEGKDDPLDLKIWGQINQVWKRSGGKTLIHKKLPRVSEGAFQRLEKWVSFERLSGGRKPGEVNTNSHYRSGKHGDWKEHFTPEVVSVFKSRFPTAVSSLGYEKDENWGL